MHQKPTAHRIDPQTGDMSGATGVYEKRLADLRELYADQDAFTRAVKTESDRIVYRVFDTQPQQKSGDLIFGATFMMPGRIGDEFFMTRGHIHARANRPETYYGESGSGVMQMESPEGETQLIEISTRVLVYVPPMWIHRSINVGDSPLVMSFCYPSDAGQDYDIIARSGGMAKRIIAADDGWTAVDNLSYRPRSAEDIARVHATAN